MFSSLCGTSIAAVRWKRSTDARERHVWGRRHCRARGRRPASTAPSPVCRVSGEGWIELVRGGAGDYLDARDFGEGEPPKRLIVVESNFAAVLKQIGFSGMPYKHHA